MLHVDGVTEQYETVTTTAQPFPAVVGLYGCPTIINNVEALSSVPAIILEGGEAYAKRGTPKNGGTRLLCVAGHIAKPGIYEFCSE